MDGIGAFGVDGRSSNNGLTVPAFGNGNSDDAPFPSAQLLSPYEEENEQPRNETDAAELGDGDKEHTDNGERQRATPPTLEVVIQSIPTIVRDEYAYVESDIVEHVLQEIESPSAGHEFLIEFTDGRQCTVCSQALQLSLPDSPLSRLAAGATRNAGGVRLLSGITLRVFVTHTSLPCNIPWLHREH